MSNEPSDDGTDGEDPTGGPIPVDRGGSTEDEDHQTGAADVSTSESEDNPGAEYVPIPEYEVTQYFPRSPKFTDEQRQRIREEYGLIRAYFKIRPDRYRNLQRWLNQARMGATFDRYLERVTYYALAMALVGALIGILVAAWLDAAGVLSTLTAPIRVRGMVGSFVAVHKELLGGAAITVLSMVVLGGGSWWAMYLYPRTVTDARRRKIDFMLPHAIVFMYALSHGGMNLLEVFNRLADSEDAYGEVANEFDMIVRDVELFGNDLVTALRNARNLTPSDSLEAFLDDLVSIIDAGGDASSFFESQSDHYLDEAQEEQESFLETLELLSEVFIVVFVAAPLFLIVILMVISFLGGSSIVMMQLLVYAAIPLGLAGFVVLISVLSDPYIQPGAELSLEDPTAYHDVDAELLEDDERYQAYEEAHRWAPVKQFLADPLQAARHQPLYSLLLTVPAVVVYLTLLATLGSLSLRATIWLGVVPFLIVAVPLSALHEIKQGRERLVTRRFPDTLNILSSANQMGIPLTDGLGMVSRWASGLFADELRLVRNDIKWNSDTEYALLSFANRLDVPQLSRTIKLIAEGGRSSGDLARILSIAADDTRNRYKIENKRRDTMSAYVAVVVISFLVFLMVVSMLETGFLVPIEQIQAEAAAQDSGAELPITLTQVPVEAYRTLFFHSALVMGAGTGLLAGKLADNSLLTGLKYSILLVALSVITFTLI